METTSNVGEQPNVKPEDAVNTSVEQGQEQTIEPTQEQAPAQVQEQKTQEEVSPEDNAQAVSTEELQTEPAQNLTEVLETTDETEPTCEPAPAPLSPDEEIIDSWLNHGKTEVTMNELINAGFDAESLDPHTNIIGRFKLSRTLLVSPYKIERNA